MRNAFAFLIVAALAGCVSQADPSSPIAAAGTPDMQESGPVTRVVQIYTYEDDGALWNVDITREAAGEVGRITVIGPGPAARARFFAAKACIEDGGQFRSDVEALEMTLPQSPRLKFVFDKVCE